MNAPGSPSSALQIDVLLSRGDFASRANVHFMPVENPAPPRPRRPESFTSSMTASGVMAVRTFFSAA